MRNKEIRDLVFAAILMALTILFSLLYLFQVSSFAAFTVAHIPVLVGAILLGKKYGALLGAVFGLTSMVFAIFTLGLNAPFTNPLLSVLPRVVFGFIIFYVYKFFEKLVKNRPLAVGLTMGVSTFLHSFMVIPLLYLFVKWGFFFNANEFFLILENEGITLYNSAILPFFIAIFVANSIIEIFVAVLVGTPIILVMDNVMNKGNEENSLSA